MLNDNIVANLGVPIREFMPVSMFVSLYLKFYKIEA
jgi:hypothetical protein